MLAFGREPTLVAAVVAAALALAILVARPRSRMHRGLSLLLFLRAMHGGLLSFSDGVTGPIDRMWPYLLLALPFAAANFAYVFWQEQVPIERTHSRLTRRIVRTTILAGAIAVELAYLLDHALFVSEDAQGFAVNGPLYAVANSWWAWLALLAVVVAWAAGRQEATRRIRSLRLVALALTLEPLYRGTYDIMGAIAGASRFGWTPDRVASLGTAAIAVALVGTAIMLLRHPVVLCGERHQGFALGSLIAWSLATTAAIAVHVVSLTDSRVSIRWLYTLHAIGFLSFAAAAAYGVTRYDFFGIEMRVRFAVKQSTVAGIIAAAFVVGNEVIEAILPLPPRAAGIAMAVVLAFTFRQVQSLAEQLVRRLMPDVSSSAEYAAARRVELYRTAVEDVARDGEIDAADAMLLERLRTRLRLAENEAQRIETEVEGAIRPRMRRFTGIVPPQA